MIKTNGYYVSTKQAYSEQHGGDYIQNEEYFKFLIFGIAGKVVKIGLAESEILESKAKKLLGESNQTFKILDDNKIEIKLAKDSSWFKPYYLQIQNANCLEDEFGKSYHFHPWEEE